MKPPEMLAMLEEAAGTRMYEEKKLQSLRIIEKKGKKVEEIEKVSHIVHRTRHHDVTIRHLTMTSHS